MAIYYHNKILEECSIEKYDYKDVWNFHKSIKAGSSLKLINLNPNVTIADCSGALGLNSFKAFGVTYAFYKMMQERIKGIYDFNTLIEKAFSNNIKVCTASDGNFGVAVSHMCKLLNIKCRVYLPKDTPKYYIDKLIELSAEIVFIKGDYDKCIAKTLECMGHDGIEVLLDTSIAGEYENSFVKNVMRGYLSVFMLIDKQFDYVFVPVGVGGLLSATISFFKSNGNNKTQIIAVEPESYNCVQKSLEKGEMVSVEGKKTLINGLTCGTVSSIAWNNIKSGTDIAMTISDEEAERGYNSLLEKGIDTGYTGAAAYSGYLMFSNDYFIEKNSKVLIINTEKSEV